MDLKPESVCTVAPEDGRKLLIHIVTNGCHESYMDAALVQRELSESGEYALTDDHKQADAIVILGCAVMQMKEDQTRDLIEYALREKRPDAEVIVLGCVAKIRPELMRCDARFEPLRRRIEQLVRFEGGPKELAINTPYRPYRGQVDALYEAARRNSRESYVDQHIPSAGRLRKASQVVLRPFSRLFYRYNEWLQSIIDVWTRDTFVLRISTGCLGACVYCAIRAARGRLRSKAVEDVLAEFRRGLDAGYR
ncbi:MAG: hypothetical protein HXY24_17705, partial [Rubrivivax sp.]|nr:hypothetical protein [Rubrivivax sp.]